MHATSTDAFSQRFLASRKHMLSPHSLQCLADIAKDPVFISYVREINIGSERVNPDFEAFLYNEVHPRIEGAWSREFKLKWDFDAALCVGRAFSSGVVS
ncbi:hypothetical protein CC86DRAFT_373596 [Ophiobolus disseminans]|uniref:Uncharacterized protein n=1 Tax=Ophiobolus disseminans TaxID=1469910 RepID=A0A6A6ZLS6_9PLEO|nr:hypothetical protein CC86DRAFT_373596 [Ophiobolus disseminans]